MLFTDVLFIFIAFGLLATLMVCVGFSFAYFIIYKRLMKGSKRLSFWQVLLWGTLFCYVFIVIGATLLVRQPIYDISRTDLNLFNQYRSAWYNFSIIEWRNIILNIAMFTPFGVMIPLLLKRMRVLWKTTAVCFVGTIFIETSQLITRRGTFALDDILHNTLGALIGYGLFYFALLIANGRPYQAKRLFSALIPLLVTITVFISFFVAYQWQEFGIMTQTYVNRLDMKNVILSHEMELSIEPTQAVIYTTSGLASVKQARAFANDFISAFGATLDETNTRIYDTVVYFYAQSPTGQTLSLSVNYLAMTYSYEDFSFLDHSRDTADEQEIREKLEKYEVYIPENVIFSENDDGVYRFDTIPKSDGSMTFSGWLECEYYDDGTIKRIYSRFVECRTVRPVNIISEQAAYKYIEKGMFRHDSSSQISSLNVISVELTYYMDSKGFLQPVYSFVSEIDGNEQTILIPAL